jgi:adenine-specific DNA-methyltransferase
LAVNEPEFDALRESLIAEGVLVKGRGRGGSVHLAKPNLEEFDLATQVVEASESALTGARKTLKPRGTATTKTDEPQVIAYRHADRRVNNPEVGMVTPDSDPEAGKTRWAYDPHLDPALQFDSGRARIESLIEQALASNDAAVQRAALEELKRLQSPYLNWTGKAERTSFEVDTVSLHVHERIDPASILRAVQKRLKDGGVKEGPSQGDFFRAWFEEPLPLAKAVEFYKHDRGWMNRMVAGDSLLVMNSLLQKEGMAGQVQMIYIDPPYGIKYGSNFQPFTNKREVKDRRDEDLTQEPEMIKAFRDTWELGIHSYLTYLRDRLLLAKELLSETGSVFVQISDENLHHVREILDEVFGAENSCSVITFRKTSGANSPDAKVNVLATVSDYVVWYAKDRDQVKY